MTTGVEGFRVEGILLLGPDDCLLQVPCVGDVDGHCRIDLGDCGENAGVPFIHPWCLSLGFVHDLDPHHAVDSFQLRCHEAEASCCEFAIWLRGPELSLS